MVEGLQILEEEEIHRGPQEREGMECRVPMQRGQGLSPAAFRCVSRTAGPRKGLGSPLPDVLNLLSQSGRVIRGHQLSWKLYSKVRVSGVREGVR